MRSKVMTNVRIMTICANEVIYSLPGGKSGLQYVHPGYFGLLNRLCLEVGRTYTVHQEIVGTFGNGGRPIFEWIEAVDQNPRVLPVAEPSSADTLLEF